MKITVFLPVLLLSIQAMATDISNVLSSHNITSDVIVKNFDTSRYNKIANQYQAKLNLNGLSEIKSATATWEVLSTVTLTTNNEILNFHIRFKLKEGFESNCGVAVNFNIDKWTPDNYVLMPAALYNGNRYESRKISYSPKLNDIRDVGPNKPMIISDVPRLNIADGPSFVQERSGGMTLPAIGYCAVSTSKSALFITTQKNRLGDYGINIEESSGRSQAIISFTSPLVRERYKYEIANNSVASTDEPANLKTGDEISFDIKLHLINSQKIQYLFDKYFDVRHDLTPASTIRYIYPFSECYRTIEQKFNTQNFVSEFGYYSVGMRENFLQDWQIGWTGGMISTYPLLFSKDSISVKNAIANFNWLFPAGIAPSGFFWDSGEKGNKWYGGDIRKPLSVNWHLIRKSGDALYYIVKQLDLMKKRKITIQPAWEKGTMQVAESFVTLWNKWGQFGNFVDSRTGDVIVGGSTSGAIVPAALVLASDYFNKPEYIEIASKAAQLMYDNYTSKGISCGGPGDAMQNPDSESGYAIIESYMLLYEKTRNEKWLNYADEAAKQFATWVMSYDYAFPSNTLFGQLQMQTTGAVFANTQNRHGSPGICTYSGLALLRLYRATSNQKYMQLLSEITQSIPQYMSHQTRPIAGMPAGWINERVSTTDWLEGIGEIKPGSTWAETAMMLTAIELPSIYIDAEKFSCFVFDHLKAEIVSGSKNSIRIKVINPTNFESNFKICIENKYKKQLYWSENKLLFIKIHHLEPGECKVINVIF